MSAARPDFLPKRGRVECLEIQEEQPRPRDIELKDFYNGIMERAKGIRYNEVPDRISQLIAERVTHPTTEKDNRWQDVVSELHKSDSCFLGKLSNSPTSFGPFYLFLKDYFPKGETNSLWTLINALWYLNCSDVLDAVQKDIANFLASEQTPLDSGFGETSLGSDRSNSIPATSLNSQVINREPRFQTHTTHCSTSDKQNKLSVAPPIETYFSNQRGNQESVQKQTPLKEIIIPKDDENDAELLPSFNFNLPDLSFLKNDYDENDVKKSKSIKVFIPHTRKYEDECAAEDLARRLRQVKEFECKPYILKNTFFYLDMDVAEFVLRVIEAVDFVVPVLSKAYLEEIQAKGNPDLMPNEQLILRYFHSVSQNRVVYRNSLNYLIRPVMRDDVTFGMVRRWNEFGCALKYPKDFGRLVQNLFKTKQLLLGNNIFS